MIQKISKHAAGRQLLEYVVGPDKDAVILGGDVVGEGAGELVQEFEAWNRLNERCENPYFHSALSSFPGDEERAADELTDEQWLEIAKGYVDKMGFSSSPHLIVRHRDTDHEHVHVVASRVYLDKDEEGRPVGARTVDDWEDYKRGMAYLRDVERDYGLHQLADYELYTSRERRPERPEYRLRERKGAEKLEALKTAHALEDPEAKQKALAEAKELEHRSVRQRLREWIGESVDARETASEFVKKLEDKGVSVRANIQSTGRVAGLSFELEGVSMKSSKVARKYSWGKMKKAGIQYDQARDLPALRAATERSHTKDKDIEHEREVGQDVRRDRSARGRGPESRDSGRPSDRAGDRRASGAAGAVGDGRAHGGPGENRADGAPDRHRRHVTGGRTRRDENQQPELAASLDQPDETPRRPSTSRVIDRRSQRHEGRNASGSDKLSGRESGRRADGEKRESLLPQHQPVGAGGDDGPVRGSLDRGDVEPEDLDAGLVPDRGAAGAHDDRRGPEDDREGASVSQGLVDADPREAQDTQRASRLDLSDRKGQRAEGDKVDRELEAAKAEALEDLAEAEKTPAERAAEQEKARQQAKLEKQREDEREQTRGHGKGDEFER